MKKCFILFVLFLLPLMASADDSGKCGTNLDYTFNSTTHTLTITGFGNMWNPDDESYYPWNSYRSAIHYLSIESGVTSIGGHAFLNCVNLLEVTIPSTINDIGIYAFRSCTSLKTFTSNIKNPSLIVDSNIFDFLPSTAKLIVPIGTKDRYKAADAWKEFKNIVEPDSDSGNCGANVSYVYDRTTHTLTISGSGDMWNLDDWTSYPWHMYRNEIQHVEIGSGVTGIGSYAFFNCTSLISVTIPSSITSIRMHAFKGCSSLITVRSGITNPFAIADDVFEGIPSYAQLIVPVGTKDKYKSKDGWKKFSFIIEIGSVFTHNGINYKIGESRTVSVTKTKEHSGDIVIPSEVTFEGVDYTVTSIEECAFDVGHIDNTMTSITLPRTLTAIGTEAFVDQVGLTAVYITDLNAWCKMSFKGSDANPLKYAHHLYLKGQEIKDLVIPSSVTSISSSAFYGCSSFTSLTLPNSLTSIGTMAFSGCSGLTGIISDIKSPFVINSNVFSGVSSTTKLFVPKGTTTVYKSTAVWNMFTDVIESVFEVDGINYRRGLDNNVSVEPGDEKYAGRIAIPSQVSYEGKTYNVTSISNNAFVDCSGLAALYLPEGLKSMGSKMFSGCTSLTCLNIPNSVTYISTGFTTGSKLDKVVIGSGIQKLVQLAIGRKLTALAVLATTPPDFDVDQNTVDYIYVPKGCITAYKDAWSGVPTDILEIVKGDVNLDGYANEDDVDALSAYIVGKYPECFFVNLADMNGDNKIDSADIVELVNLIK